MPVETENRKMTNIRLPPKLLEELSEHCRTARPPVTKTAVIEMLIRDYLAVQKVAEKPSAAKKR